MKGKRKKGIREEEKERGNKEGKMGISTDLRGRKGGT